MTSKIPTVYDLECSINRVASTIYYTHTLQVEIIKVCQESSSVYAEFYFKEFPDVQLREYFFISQYTETVNFTINDKWIVDKIKSTMFKLQTLLFHQEFKIHNVKA